jgi:hypothetical protein
LTLSLNNQITPKLPWYYNFFLEIITQKLRLWWSSESGEVGSYVIGCGGGGGRGGGLLILLMSLWWWWWLFDVKI